MLSVIQPKYSLSYEEAQKRLNQCQDQDFDIPNFSNIPQQLSKFSIGFTVFALISAFIFNICVQQFLLNF